jgi:hypothetical protein
MFIISIPYFKICDIFFPNKYATNSVLKLASSWSSGSWFCSHNLIVASPDYSLL